MCNKHIFYQKLKYQKKGINIIIFQKNHIQQVNKFLKKSISNRTTRIALFFTTITRNKVCFSPVCQFKLEELKQDFCSFNLTSFERYGFLKDASKNLSNTYQI